MGAVFECLGRLAVLLPLVILIWGRVKGSRRAALAGWLLLAGECLAVAALIFWAGRK